MTKPTILTYIDTGTSDGSSRVMRAIAQQLPPRHTRFGASWPMTSSMTQRSSMTPFCLSCRVVLTYLFAKR
ncbi:hypothetical protein LP417_22810 [Polaromonas sp. P1-6]|nr:hypothetical protein LP417_22810 [Polaromonas sp. P1-6]